MNPLWEAQFGPNSEGWSITFRSAPQQNENFDFVIDLKGPECFFSAGTFDARPNLASFSSELAKVFRTLSGTANLDTDYFALTVTAEKTGSLRFAGNLVCHQFSQFPTGHVRVDFEQSFDPITIESAVKKLEQPVAQGGGEQESRPMKNDEVNRAIISRNKLPPLFPTHEHSPQFWEQLGRTIATYGFLEEVLGKAIFAFTATRNYDPDEIDAAYQAWLPQLERALTDQLWNLAESYGKAARDNPATTIENLNELVEDIKKATVIRNVLCHGSWRTPNANGAAVPLFVNRQKLVFDTAIDIAYLKKVQIDVAALACSVIDTVTHMGWQFPGGAGPGKPIMERN